jgi:hypothetical protein
VVALGRAQGGGRVLPPGWASWAAWATQADWAKSQERILSNLNRIFGICQGFENLHKEIWEEF